MTSEDGSANRHRTRGLRTLVGSLALGLVLLAASVSPAAAAADTLSVTVLGGLPAGETPLVHISGPDGFRATARGATTYRNLAAGSYVATASNITFNRTTPSGALAGATAIGLVESAGGIKPNADRAAIRLAGAGIHSKGTVYVYYTSAAPSGSTTFKHLADGHLSTCGLTTGGIITCWGQLDDDLPPAGAFTNVEGSQIGGDCGFRPDGSIACWGPYSGPYTIPAREFTQVDPSTGITCGLRIDGSISCWLLGDWRSPARAHAGVIPVPAGAFVGLRADGFVQPGYATTDVCGLRSDHSVACADLSSVGQVSRYSPAGTYSQLTNGCLLATSGTPTCLSFSSTGAYAGTYAVTGTCTTAATVDAGCVDPQGQPTTFPNNQVMPVGVYTQLSDVGNCGLLLDGAIACSTDMVWDAMTPPVGPFTEVTGANVDTNGEGYACALRADGTVACWGTGNSQRALITPPQ